MTAYPWSPSSQKEKKKKKEMPVVLQQDDFGLSTGRQGDQSQAAWLRSGPLVYPHTGPLTPWRSAPTTNVTNSNSTAPKEQAQVCSSLVKQPFGDDGHLDYPTINDTDRYRYHPPYSEYRPLQDWYDAAENGRHALKSHSWGKVKEMKIFGGPRKGSHPRRQGKIPPDAPRHNAPQSSAQSARPRIKRSLPSEAEPQARVKKLGNSATGPSTTAQLKAIAAPPRPSKLKVAPSRGLPPKAVTPDLTSLDRPALPLLAPLANRPANSLAPSEKSPPHSADMLSSVSGLRDAAAALERASAGSSGPDPESKVQLVSEGKSQREKSRLRAKLNRAARLAKGLEEVAPPRLSTYAPGHGLSNSGSVSTSSQRATISSGLASAPLLQADIAAAYRLLQENGFTVKPSSPAPAAPQHQPAPAALQHRPTSHLTRPAVRNPDSAPPPAPGADLPKDGPVLHLRLSSAPRATPPLTSKMLVETDVTQQPSVTIRPPSPPATNAPPLPTRTKAAHVATQSWQRKIPATVPLGDDVTADRTEAVHHHQNRVEKASDRPLQVSPNRVLGPSTPPKTKDVEAQQPPLPDVAPRPFPKPTDTRQPKPPLLKGAQVRSPVKEGALGHGNLVEGQTVAVVVEMILWSGLKLRIADSTIRGFCHRSQISDDPTICPKRAISIFRVGDRFKAILLTLDPEISFSIKPSSFAEKAAEIDEVDGVQDKDSDDAELSDVKSLSGSSMTLTDNPGTTSRPELWFGGPQATTSTCDATAPSVVPSPRKPLATSPPTTPASASSAMPLRYASHRPAWRSPTATRQPSPGAASPSSFQGGRPGLLSGSLAAQLALEAEPWRR